jgi:hypothetical protein
MQKISSYIKKNWAMLVLLVIISVAFFVRFYKFDEWLYFKMDQSRDALLISQAVNNGPGYLPLLGARAGSTKLKHGFLRLGPIFYYFQYLSGKIFNSTEPYVFAYPDLFFSILALPTLYLILRLYFSRKYSLMITAMYAFSFIIIQYSRFSWNPNALQFFLLLAFYGLLKMLNEPDEKKRKWWIAIWAFGATIGSQLHFFGFFSLMGISGLLIIFHFKLWKKSEIEACLEKKVFKKIIVYVGIVLLIFLIFYVPVLISDSRKNFQNSKNFIEALGSKPANKPLSDKIQKGITENLKYYCLITTSQCYEKNGMQKELPAIAFTGLILLGGFILIIRFLKKEINPLRKDFLLLLLTWVGIFFIITIPISFQLRPRFFIVVFAVPFIFLGLIFNYLEEKFGKKTAFPMAFILTAGVIGWNCHGTYQWFKEQTKSQKSAFAVKRTLILKNKDGVTLGELQRVTDYIYAHRKAGARIYYYVKPEHVRPIDYLLLQKHNQSLKFSNMKLNGDPQAQFFAITPAKSGLTPVTKKFKEAITIISSEQIGQLKVWEIAFPNRIIDSNFKFKATAGEKDRLYWKDVFVIKSKKSSKQ